MPEVNNNNETQESSKKSVSIGALLTNARNVAALSQADIAEQINLPKRIIQALEADDFNNLPESTYIRGYLRNYARVVGINDKGLVKLYVDQHYSEPIIEPSRRTKQSYDPAILWSTAAVLSILVGLVITWWFDYNQVAEQDIKLVMNEVVVEGKNVAMPQASNDKNSTSNASNESTIQAAHETTESSSSDEPFGVNKQSAIGEEVVTADQQQAMEDASRNPTLVTSVDSTHVLTVTYIEKSWTEIRDANSNTLMQGLIEPGVVRNLKGKPPFEIFLGNAPGVVIEVNGLYFDHSQYSRSNHTARFQVSSGSLN